MTTIYYRTRDGEDYRFALERRKAGYRIYILDYTSERAERSALHRLRDHTGAYICWSGPIPTEAAALAVAAQWAENVQRYVRTGQAF